MPKAFALVLRRGAERVELLVFDHPHTPPQLPKGTVDPGETPLQAAIRELAEESGVTAVATIGALEPFDIANDVEDSVSPRQRWHAIVMRPTEALPDAWDHEVSGGGEDHGMTFGCRFAPLDGLADALHPIFRPMVERLADALRSDTALRDAVDAPSA